MSSNGPQLWQLYARHNGTQYVCTYPSPAAPGGVCGFQGPHTAMQGHVSVHVPDPARALSCQVCGWLTAPNHRAFLNAHFNAHMMALNQPCPQCGRMFTEARARFLHIFNEHNYVPNA